MTPLARRFVALAIALATLGTLAACEVNPVPAPGVLYPGPATAGLPAGWTSPGGVHQGTLVITQPNSVWRDITVTGSVEVRAPNVTLDRMRVHGRIWNQWYPPVAGSPLTQFSMVVTNSTVGDATLTAIDVTQHGAIGPGNYVAFNNEVYGSDGFRVSAPQAISGGDGRVTIEGNYFRAADVGGNCAFHVDGVQGYFGGPGTVVRNNTLDAFGLPCVSGVIFFADHSQGATVEGNLLMASSYPLRVQEDADQAPQQWVVRRNALVWSGGPGALHPGVECGLRSTLWQDNHRVAVDAPQGRYRVSALQGAVPC
jgi:hypothetical protein